MIRYIPEGGKIPFWYGHCYYTFDQEKKAMLPIPLNILWRWLRNLWFWLKEKTKGHDVVSELYRLGYDAGIQYNNRMMVASLKEEWWNAGYQQGWDDCLENLNEKITEHFTREA